MTSDQFSSKQSAVTPPEVPAERTALLVVDLVNDYVEPAGAMPVADAGPVLAAATRLANGARAAGVLPVWIRPGHLEAADGLFRKRIPHAMGESWGAQIHDSLPFADGDRVLLKRRYSAFFQTDLDMYLREHRIERVVVCGVALNICVRSTVHDAFFLGYDVWVAPDASQATGPREEASTLYDIETHFGEVRTVDQILEAWG